MEQCYRYVSLFLAGYRTMQSLAQTSEDEIFGHHMLQNSWDNKLSSFTPKVFQCIHQTQSSLTYLMSTLFSKEHVISGSHPVYLVCRWDPLDPPKKWPKWPRLSGSSDPLLSMQSLFCLSNCWLIHQKCIKLHMYMDFNSPKFFAKLPEVLNSPKFILPMIYTVQYSQITCLAGHSTL